MDDNTRLLEQIRDLMQRNLDLATQRMDLARSHALFYKRVVAAGAIVVAALVIYLFNLLRRE